MGGYTENMITKKDLDNLVTKDLLKESLKPLATKKDLEKFVTKDELKISLQPMASKKDLKMSENRIVNKIVNKINIVADFFDKKTMDLERRTERLEKHTRIVSI